MTPAHIPVLLPEMLRALQPVTGGCYVDATFGAGGYSNAILNAADCRVIGIDRDRNSLDEAAPLVEQFKGRLTLVTGRFGTLDTLVEQPVDGVAFDLGVSSMQLDRAERGFSFRFDGPLDMRMGQNGPTAADLVNKTSEEDLADIIYLYGEERHSRRIARAIVAARTIAPLTTTRQLAEAVRRAIPQKKPDIDPATRTFQALRIAVNDELGELESGLQAAEKILRPGGILVVVTFHSLEDRVVKTFLKLRSGDVSAPSRHSPAPITAQLPSFQPLTRKAISAGDSEIAANPRARSAKLRAARRTDSPSWQVAA